jgi:hypothetical protein
MSVIGTAVVQAYLCQTRQLDFAGATAAIDDSHRAQLAICLRSDTNRPAGLNVAIPASKLRPIRVKFNFVFIGAAT